jgi:hypothetical protein
MGRSWFEFSAVCFLGSHIPITLLVDGQAVLPASLYPPALRDLIAAYAAAFNDELMAPGGRPPWFKAIVCVELTLQMAYFFYALRAFAARENSMTFRRATIVYAAHVSTTLVPVLGTFLASGTFASEVQRWSLIGIYSPYLFMPLALLAWALADAPLFSPRDSGSGKAAAKEGGVTRSPARRAMPARAGPSAPAFPREQAFVMAELAALARAFEVREAGQGGGARLRQASPRPVSSSPRKRRAQ